VIISLRIRTTYEADGQADEVLTIDVTGADVPPAPPMTADVDADADDMNDWALQHLQRFTGPPRPGRRAWHDVQITGCSRPDLIRVAFYFGN